jgi:hypothetical protein
MLAYTSPFMKGVIATAGGGLWDLSIHAIGTICGPVINVFAMHPCQVHIHM